MKGAGAISWKVKSPPVVLAFPMGAVSSPGCSDPATC